MKKKPLIMVWIGMDDPGIVTAGKEYRILYRRRNHDEHLGVWYSYAFKHDDGQVDFADSRLFVKPKPRRLVA